MRLGEVFNLKWDGLNHQSKAILIRDRKHAQQKIGNNQQVPLLGKAFDIVRAQPRTHQRVLPFNGESVGTAWLRAVEAAKLQDVRFHDLRHDGLSRLAERGWSIPQLAAVSGHRDWKQASRYVQLDTASRHDLPPSFGHRNSQFRRCRQWARSGVFESLFNAMSEDPDPKYARIDGTIVQVHQKATGARKKGRRLRPLGARVAG